MTSTTRRTFVRNALQLGALAALGGCTTTGTPPVAPTAFTPPPPLLPTDPLFLQDPSLDTVLEGTPDYAMLYGPVFTEPFPVNGIDLTRIEPQFLRQRVRYFSDMEPGSIVVDPAAHFLYFIQPDNWAVRYGVGTGKAGFSWSGLATIKFKREWPDWYPVQEYIDRNPRVVAQLSQLQSGMGIPGGSRNPIGARGLYLWQGDVDTLYRIHGTLEPYSIGRNVSSGCIRMINQDAMDLFKRVQVGATVKVTGDAVVASL